MKKSIFTLTMAILLTFAGTLYAQNISLGIAAKASTTGLGGDVVVRFHERMTARVGYDKLAYNRSFLFEESGIEYDVNAAINAGAILALYDFYLSDIVFVSAGLGINNFNINAKGVAVSGLPWGDITIPAERVGNFEFDVKPGLSATPYLGIGFGRTLGKEKSLAFAFELGSYYQGEPKVTIESSGLIAPTSNPDFGQKDLLEGQISQYYLFPVLKFNLSYRILSL